MGYDLRRFVSQVDEEFLCPICTMVLHNGVQSQRCEHNYCEKCIKQWLDVNQNCPIDRIYLSLNELKPITRVLRNLLFKLEIKCEFENEGCISSIKLENIESHVKSCAFNPNLIVVCDKDCGLEMNQNEHKTHNCLSKLSSVVIAQQSVVIGQQKQISILENELFDLRNKHTLVKWLSLTGLSINRNIIECKTIIGDNALYGYAQSPLPFDRYYNYSEIKVIHLGEGKYSLFGLTNNRIECYDSNNDSFYELLYDGTNGIATIWTQTDDREIEIVPKWEIGDLIGCGVKFTKHDNKLNDRVFVYFSHNKQIVYEKSVLNVDIGLLYPTFYTDKFGAKVVVI